MINIYYRKWDEIGTSEQNDFLSWLDGESNNLSLPENPSDARAETKPALMTNWDTSEEGFIQQLSNELLNHDRFLERNDHIRQMCMQNGCIPHELRLTVWRRLLKVS